MKEVLFLTLYPIKPARHGGQHRASNLIKMYESEGYNVNHLYSIYETDPWASLTGDYKVIPARALESVRYDVYVPEIADFLMGLYLEQDEEMERKIVGYLESGNTKIIHLEQPWLYPLIERIKTEHANIFSRIQIVYGSQNMEYKLKQNMIPDSISCKQEIIEDIFNLEVIATKGSDIVLAVSNDEKQVLEQWNKNTILARNGVSEKKVDFSDIKFASTHLDCKYFLFIGSAHKPNLDGFIDLVGGAMGCVPPDMKMVIVGGVNHLIHNHPDFLEWRDINESKLLCFTDVSDSQLQLIIEKSEVIILPILSGGGTNLKTAEALLSKKSIIGTTVSFRDFENYIDDSVQIANTKKDFQSAMRTFTKQDIVSSRTVDGLLWSSCLSEFKNIVKVL